MNTEQRYMLAVGLSFLVLMVFYPSLSQKKKSATSPTKQEETLKEIKTPKSTDSAIQKIQEESAKPETIEFQNDIYNVKLNSQGASLSELTFKKKRKDKAEENVMLVKPITDLGAFLVDIPGYGESLANANYKVESADLNQGKASFVYERAGDLKIRKQFVFTNDKSAFQLLVEIENLSKSTKEIPLSVSSQIYFGKEQGRFEHDQMETFVVPRFSKIKVIKEGKAEKAPFVVSEAIEWIALARHYFSVILKPDVDAIESSTKVIGNKEGFESTLKFPAEQVPSGGILKRSFLIHAGPEYYEDLKSFGSGFEATLSQGLWGFFRHWLFEGLRVCKNLTGNYGFAILLMTFFIKVLFSPFTHMSFESMRKMQAIQPKMKAIQTQFKNDPTRMNKEVMELYKRNKVNPMGGCLPMLIQIPIFISFYQVLAQFVELKGESLFWIADLTQPDRLAKIPGINFDLNILPLLMIGTMIWQQKVTPQQATTSPEQAMIMQWMPVIFGFMFYQLPSGLVLYWTLNNLLTVSHQMIFHHKSKPIVEE